MLITMLFSDMTGAFYIGFVIFPPNLARIGRIVKKWHLFFEFKMAAAAILTFDYCPIFGHNTCVPHRIRNIPTKLGEDWSISNELALFFEKTPWGTPVQKNMSPHGVSWQST
jgi:hypothetical protein